MLKILGFENWKLEKLITVPTVHSETAGGLLTQKVDFKRDFFQTSHVDN